MAHNAQRDEVYVLSLPGFVWFKADYTSVDPRIYHTCHVVGNQMLSIGGLKPSLAKISTAVNDTDLFWEGIKVFDMTALEWTNYYNASSAPYNPSKVISDYYGGELGFPSWSLPAVENLFINRTLSKSSPSPTPLHKAMTYHLEGTIGGTVGGIGVSLVSIACIILLSLRRKRKKLRERREATGRLPLEHEMGPRQVPGGLYEADDTLQPAEAGQGEPRTGELDTGQPVPQEVDAVALGNLFELENLENHNGPGHASTPLELGCHTNGIASTSLRNPLELGNPTRQHEAGSNNGPIESQTLPN